MTRMWIPITVLFFAISTSFLGQDLTSGGPDSIIAGPFGEPRMVMSEGGEWSYPIKVFVDDKVEAFVPDITSPGWISWHVAEFREKGTYFTYLYIYNRVSRKTGRETIYVDSRANVVTVARPLLPPFRIQISKASPELSRSIAKITVIVKDDAQTYHGSTVQEDILRQKMAVLRMALCSGPGTQNPDCSLSDSDFAKKHPIYATASPQLIPGAIPGVNCGIGTNRSCCCAGDSATSDAPASPPTPQTGGSPAEQTSRSSVSEGVQLLSDTEGVDFSSWVTSWRQDSQSIWRTKIATLRGAHKHGVVVLRLKVSSDGHVLGNSVALEGSSGDPAVDGIAWNAVLSQTSSPLPSEFRAPYMEMRVTFVYR